MSRKKKDYKYKPNQIGGMVERIEAIVGRTFNPDELRVLDYLMIPAMCGKDQHGSFGRARASFDAMLSEAARKNADMNAAFAAWEKREGGK